jgi:hypothetical protein
MTTTPLNAIDAVRPAIDRVRAELFQPFRLGIWLRFAFLAFLTGEMSSGGGGIPNTGYHVPAQPSGSSDAFLAAARAPFAFPPLAKILPFIIVGAIVFVLMFLLFLWISSVLRFVLLEGVITGQPHIRQGWRRWKLHGNALFAWRLVFTVIVFAAYAVFLGLPAFAAWRAGFFRNPHDHLVALILGGLIFGFLAVVMAIATLVIWVLTKDFVVPMMAAEGISPVEGWRRLKLFMTPQKGGYAGYVLFKAVLAMAAGIIVAIIAIAIIFILVIPFVLIAVAMGILGGGGGIAASALAITVLILFAVIAVGIIITVMATVSVPIVVFFQSYSLHFFAPRYEPLARLMWPTPA